MCISEKQCLLNGAYANIHPWSSVCRQGIQSDAQWLEANLGPFSPYTTYADLKVFNLSGVSHPCHYQSPLKTAAQYCELGKSAHSGGFAVSKRKAGCVSSGCVTRWQLWTPSHQSRRLS